MPALSSNPLLNTFDTRSPAIASNTTIEGLHVLCAWPVSGQYGPGSRILYYVLIAACVFARKAEWMKNACLAAALLLPAVAALHSIVLVSIHVPGAVDMDVYGAFQLCSIGILTAPVTVKLSKTYFNDPGRNTIFLWTVLILMGLLSLTIEFYRSSTSLCTDNGRVIPHDQLSWPINVTCDLTCDVNLGPFSPMRQDAANNIYVIPAPTKLTFDTATLLAAACCIPAILSLVSMWSKILEINWKRKWGRRNEETQHDVLLTGTNGATVGMMHNLNGMVRQILSVVEIPFVLAAVVGILALGELNFWSAQVLYQTEPIASIGQWGNIVGTALAVLGSLYLLLASPPKAKENELETTSGSPVHHHHCNCSGQHVNTGGSSRSTPPATISEMRQTPSNGGTTTVDELEIVQVSSLATLQRSSHSRVSSLGSVDVGGRHRVARALKNMSDYVGTASHDRFDDESFKRGRGGEFPTIPGEENRNRALPQIQEKYDAIRDAEGKAIRESRSRSRAMSFNSTTGRSPSPRSASPRRSMSQAERRSEESINPSSPSVDPGQAEGMRRPRRDTLEVPSQGHRVHVRTFSASSAVSISVPRGPTSPTILISSNDDSSSAVESPVDESPPSGHPF